jgi:hypothetical protein
VKLSVYLVSTLTYVFGTLCVLGGCTYRYVQGSWGRLGDPVDFLYYGVMIILAARTISHVETHRQNLLQALATWRDLADTWRGLSDTWESAANRWRRIANESAAIADEALAQNREFPGSDGAVTSRKDFN